MANVSVLAYAMTYAAKERRPFSVQFRFWVGL